MQSTVEVNIIDGICIVFARHWLDCVSKGMHGMQLSVEITSTDGSLKLRASGSQVVFAGYLKAFENFDTGKEGSSGKHTTFRSAFGFCTQVCLQVCL